MKQILSLNGAWQMRPADETSWLNATVPGSVYADLLDSGRMEDPFWRANELKAAGSAHGAGLSIGGGLQTNKLKLGVTWAKYHVDASSLLFNLSYSF